MNVSTFGITPEKKNALKHKMKRLGINESDIVEKFVRSAGAGGQKVNKTSTCVYLKHLPTGIEVKCQKERNQSLNRFFARRILLEKIQRQILNKKTAAEQRIAKIKRQKRKRSKRAKEKILKLKKMRSEKKKLRAIKTDIDLY